MIIKELFQKDIYRTINGVVYADKTDNDIVAQELDEYVLTSELRKHLNRLFEVYSESLKKADSGGHMGVWISGFFGSGKSHFLKILSYLFENRHVKIDGETKHAIDFFREKISDNMAFKMIEDAVKIPTDVILFNIDSLSFQNDEQAAVLKAFFGVFNRKRGYCFLYPHIAHVESFLVKKGVYDDFKNKFEALNGSSWETDREDYVFYADEMLQAIREVLPNQSENAELSDWITNGEKRYPLTIENFAREVADYVDTKGRRLLFMADEMGQFIGMNSNRMLNLQTIVENLGTQAKGKAWVFVTSQEDIDSVLGQKIQTKGNDFSKIQGRFYTRFSLSSSSIAEVIQKRILQKNTAAEEILAKEYAEQRDILLNQLSFGPGTPTMPSFTTVEEYCRSYPFVPYQFNLLQDVFDIIRSIGATGLNLSKGERSMLEAFQTALKAIGNNKTGALVPLSNFFPTVQSFLDGSVARSIYNAQEIAGITEFDIELLKTLFLIRYLKSRRIPCTIQNLSVLTLAQVDTDMVSHRREIEESLIKLEKENLITRENEEFFFLTIEEQSITREIQNTEVPATREIKELASLLFRDHFDGRNKYRHANGKSFDIQLSLDGYNQTTKGDISVEFYSPISGSLYETKKANPFLASGGNSNIVALLPESPAFYRELTLYLKTDQYLSSSSGRELTSGEENILAQKARENVARRNRLATAAADLVADTTITILGTPYQSSSRGKADFLMEICEYYVTAQFTKLNLLSDPFSDWERTVKTLLSPNKDIMLDEHNIANPKALADIRQFIMLSHAAGKATMLSEIVAKYAKMPYGWPDGNAQVLVAYLFRQGEVLVWHNSSYPEPTACVDLFIKSSLYDKVRIEKAVGVEDEVLERVSRTAQALFIDYPPATTRELAHHIKKHLAAWQQNVHAWIGSTQHSPASYPGTDTLKEINAKISELLKCVQDTELVTTVDNERDTFAALGEDYRKLEAFHSHQIRMWREAINVFQTLAPVIETLSSQDGFAAAYETVASILKNPAPWEVIKDLGPAVQTLSRCYEAQIVKARDKSLTRIDDFRTSLNPECESLQLDPGKIYQVKARLNKLHDQCKTETNLATLSMILASGAEQAYNNALEVLQTFRQAKAAVKTETVYADAPVRTAKEKTEAAAQKPVAYEKPVQQVRVIDLLNSRDLETPADIDDAVEDLRSKLKLYIAQGKKIRLE